MIIDKQIIEDMIEHSKKEAPNEACGLLAGENNVISKIFKMTNDEHSSTRYLVSPKEQFKAFKSIREEGLSLLGIYHSHVGSEATPSETDIKLAFYDVAYFIVSLENSKPVVKAFRIKDGQVSSEEIEIR